jgi:hypothetical protein
MKQKQIYRLGMLNLTKKKIMHLSAYLFQLIDYIIRIIVEII